MLNVLYIISNIHTVAMFLPANTCTVLGVVHPNFFMLYFNKSGVFIKGISPYEYIKRHWGSKDQ
jgi:hypothetical protein